MTDRIIGSGKPNRLPASYALRLKEAGITHLAVAEASARMHPEGRTISRKFVTACLGGAEPCPGWLRDLLDNMLASASEAQEVRDHV